MFEDRDRFSSYYVERLWGLLPGIYRSMDYGPNGEVGPLRELVVRIGTEIAVLRRGIERTWENQSIESCDDWLIPYLGDLLATNLVAGLNPRAQRLDVANTIYYRRRKGTLAILEQIAADLTGWNARAVEFFTRLGRTRHQYDPPLGTDRDEAVIAGLIGARSHTARGGFADLRHAKAAADAATAFDEFAHIADFRRGADASGWHNIPKLGLFLWRLKSFPCGLTTPVEHAACPGQFTFDPTGREIPLFARDVRDASQYGDNWVTPDQWMLPTPIDPELLIQNQSQLYPDALTPEPLDQRSLSVVRVGGGLVDLLPFPDLIIHPERGRFQLQVALPTGAVPQVRYHYGFSSEIGAGPYDRRALGQALPPQPAPTLPTVSGGAGALAAAIAGPTSGTITIADSLTYDPPPDLGAVSDLLVRAEQNQRPVLRWAGGAWVLTGADATAQVTLEGLLLSGGDMILRGRFATVELFCTTLDPGEAPDQGGNLVQAIDGRPLLPVTLWIEGQVGTLRLRRSITGPIRTRLAGKVARIEAEDSIVQGVRTEGFGPFIEGSIGDPQQLARRWKTGQDPLTVALRPSFAADLQAALTDYDPATTPDAGLTGLLVGGLAAAVALDPLYSAARFAALPLPPELVAAALASPSGAALAQLNRQLLEIAYPVALAPAAIASVEAELSLSRTTCLGSVFAHRISASETILASFARATDIQNGCVRFVAYAAGSRLHQPYESVALRTPAAIFVSQRYGDPGYAQLSRLADREILDGAPGGSILAGAENGAEIGAFGRELNAVKQRGLMLKLLEFMPVGLNPILIFVT